MFKDNNMGWREITLLILIAYAFSFAIRLIWIWQFKDNPNFMWNDQLMINTNDGYFFASAVEYLLTGAHADNPRVSIALDSYPGMVYASYYLTRFTPMSLETVILYAPSIIASLVVIPIILTGRLLRLTWVGFFAALLGSIAWSYYNRTMIGYYDSDMFSVLLQFTILYLFLLTIYIKDDKNILWLAFALLVYPFFYPQGLSLIYAMFILWVLYQLVFQKNEQNSYLFIIIASVALWAVPIWLKM
ncbi:MAG TPA: peptide-binding protein, partial [Epsilonproteobacteria bacterium]|nr:peptide-binding protein [Campylobacterota bacterium]